MTLLIRDQLTCPPTWFASYRDLTLYCAIFLHLDIVIESEDPDTYYRWIKPRGGMDFIEDIIRPGSERGRLSRKDCSRFLIACGLGGQISSISGGMCLHTAKKVTFAVSVIGD